MRCEEAGRKLLELMEDDLPPGRRVEVLGHLEGCAACAAEFSEYRDLMALVQADPVPEQSPRFWEDFVTSLRRRIEREASSGNQVPAPWWTTLRSWFGVPYRVIAGTVAVAIAILIMIRVPGILSRRASRDAVAPSVEQVTRRGGEGQTWVRLTRTEDGRREVGEPFVIAGETVDDPSTLAAALQRLPWVDEIADRIETAWVWRPESDPGDWISSLSEEERQVLLDRLRSFRWSQS